MKLYGIPNCNTVKKARDWLATNNIAYEFYDFKKIGIDSLTLAEWLSQIPHEKLINRAGLTWRSLSDKAKALVVDNKSAIALMQDKTSVIKRPILVNDNQVISLGFDESSYQKLLIK
ncbi:MAG: arsenate reductase [Methylophilaceae bacterium]|nr:arsenate reductase [Methylophilaceae bacterium]